MKLYVNPFWAGVIMTILVGLGVVIIAACIDMGRKK